ncbi:hypothetical protein Ciccas_001060 [Cichlidogyrus casuarinus]|uniref:Uncharacterized protein n=1 Tax=Cichlidogyrus casuarinus TaxID=1844966 RepID=A0ABD2QL47_9PLAT
MVESKQGQVICAPRQLSRVESIANCKQGLVSREKVDVSDGVVTYKLVFQVIKNCECMRFERTKKYVEKCPPPRTSQTCDLVTGELVTSTMKYYLEAGACKEVFDEKRKKITCPVFDKMVAKQPCDPESGMQKLLFRKATYQNCRCLIEDYEKTRRCQCPPKRQISTTCDSLANELVTKFIDYQLLPNGECNAIEKQERKKPACVNEPLDRSAMKLRCDEETGVGSILMPVRELSNCHCFIKYKVIKRKKCLCPLSRVSMRCDTINNIFLRTKHIFTLDQKTFSCIYSKENNHQIIRKLNPFSNNVDV